MIKKGWDQLYRDPVCEEGFLSRAREARAGWQEDHKEAKRKTRDESVKDYITETVQTVESTFHTGCV